LANTKLEWANLGKGSVRARALTGFDSNKLCLKLSDLRPKLVGNILVVAAELDVCLFGRVERASQLLLPSLRRPAFVLHTSLHVASHDPSMVRVVSKVRESSMLCRMSEAHSISD
jgi:hypothetical protein